MNLARPVAGTTYPLRYTPRLVRQAAWCFARWRLLGSDGRLWLAQGLLVGAAVALATARAWGWAVACVAVAALPPGLGLVGWIAHRRHKLRTLEAMGAPVARLAVDAEALHFCSDAGRLVLPWATIVAWRERPEFWLLLTAPNRFTILPTAGLPAALRAELRARLEPSRRSAPAGSR